MWNCHYFFRCHTRTCKRRKGLVQSDHRVTAQRSRGKYFRQTFTFLKIFEVIECCDRISFQNRKIPLALSPLYDTYELRRYFCPNMLSPCPPHFKIYIPTTVSLAPWEIRSCIMISNGLGVWEFWEAFGMSRIFLNFLKTWFVGFLGLSCIH